MQLILLILFASSAAAARRRTLQPRSDPAAQTQLHGFPSSLCVSTMDSASRWKQEFAAEAKRPPIVGLSKAQLLQKLSATQRSKATVDSVQDGIFVASAAKAGSSTLRAFQKAVHIKNFSWDKPMFPRADVGFIVRDPATRFVAGAFEILFHHCQDWTNWRKGYYRSRERRALPLSALDANATAKDLDAAAPASAPGPLLDLLTSRLLNGAFSQRILF